MSEISIIIPCYMAENYIEKCLLSISHQTFRDFEVILVNDCSPDNTLSVVEKVILENSINIKVINNEYNLGPSKSRKKGIEAAESEYVCFCDSDDWIDPNFLDLMMKASNHGKNDIVFCNFQSVYSDGKIVKHDVISSIKSLEKKDLVGRSFDSMCCMMIRRSIVVSMSFPDIRNGEDMAVIPTIVASSNTFGFVDSYIYNYFYHKGSLSKTYTDSMVDSLRESFVFIRKSIGSDYPEETEFLGIRNYLYGGLLNLFKSTFDIKRANMILNEFEIDYPHWEKCNLFYSLPFYKKIYLRNAKARFFVICWFMSKIHKAISK